MLRWWVSWPVAVAAVITVLNVELVFIPALAAYGISGALLFVYTAIAASAEVGYWYWFVGWLAAQAPNIGVVRQTVHEFRGQGLHWQLRRRLVEVLTFGSQLWSWFSGHVRRQTEARGPIPRWMLSHALTVVRSTPVWMMYPMMIGLGLCPLGWIPGILICRKFRVRGAFATLLFFNAVKTYAIGLGWTALLHRTTGVF